MGSHLLYEFDTSQDVRGGEIGGGESGMVPGDLEGESSKENEKLRGNRRIILYLGT